MASTRLLKPLLFITGIGVGVLAAKFAITALLVFLAAAAAASAAITLFKKVLPLPAWMLLTLTALTGYMLLNYGFDNLALIGGFPIPVGELLIGGAFGFALLRFRAQQLYSAMADPVMVSISALIVLSAVHLLADIGKYGSVALRDASIFVEGAVFLLGWLWPLETSSRILLKWLFVFFVVNLLYSYTFPFSEEIQQRSPVSGIYHPVAIFGQYQHIHIYLVAGALFCLWFGLFFGYRRGWLLALAVAQLVALAILQARAAYLGTALALLLLALTGQIERARQFGYALALAVATGVVAITVVSAAGITVQGRVDKVDLQFLAKQVASLSSIGTSAYSAMPQDDDRLDWYSQVWEKTSSDTSSLIFGRGFGEPLIDFTDMDGNPVRQPHNSTLTVLGRLGLTGLAIWLALHSTIVVRFLGALRKKPSAATGEYALILWLFLLYVLMMLVTSVQPTLDFSHGAIPFYFFLGVGMHLVDWHRAAVVARTARPVRVAPPVTEWLATS
jgi:O-antigen ligase